MDEPDPSLLTLLDRVSEHTDVTYGDLAMFGASMLSTISTIAINGWSSPGSSLDYTGQVSDPHTMLVRDFVAWTSHRNKLADGCEERLRSYVEESGWTLHVLNQVATLLSPPSPMPD
ncbi:hypothetical protein IEZ26_06690 [Nocardioides cavernae]|uniref:Uncharacterized protein n=1 Tax=Nocardioides cavernae TaxID=1921566 RepID=A0ABR8N833_9ACTN|nr:hypothetical protein [Nocardioides cavernae]MBD3924303.1 hypothetical protein [Nocardioides cavernae]MBM7510755.1 hypothetical protein [Nocardioides cavernae]